MKPDILKKHADEILDTALHSVDPYHLIKEQIRGEEEALLLFREGLEILYLQLKAVGEQRVPLPGDDLDVYPIDLVL